MAKVRVPLSMVLAGWAWRRAMGLFSWFCRRPIAVAAFVALLAAVAGDRRPRSPAALVPASQAWSAGLVALRLWAPEHFTRWVAWRAKGWWRAARVYRYLWQPAMVTTGLAVRVDGEEYLPQDRLGPQLGHRRPGARCRMLPGQVLDDWADDAPRLAQTFGAQECRVRTVAGRRRDLELWFLVEDPLTAEVPPFDHGRRDRPRRRCRSRVREDGLTYRLRLLGTHLLVVGATGSGQGLGAVVDHRRPGSGDPGPDGAGLGARPQGRDGAGRRRAAVRAVRLRRPRGRGPPTRSSSPALLEDAVAMMRRRQARLRGVTRLHTPTARGAADRGAGRRARLPDRLRHRPGRQDAGSPPPSPCCSPRAARSGSASWVRCRTPARRSSPCGTCSRPGSRCGSPRPTTSGWSSAPGARDRGARCDQIPESLPGVGYVGIDGIAEPVRVRFSHITDAHIARLVARYGTEPAFMPVVETRRAAA